MKGKEEAQTEIPMLKTGKESGAYRRGYGLRTEMTDYPSPSSSPPIKTEHHQAHLLYSMKPESYRG